MERTLNAVKDAGKDAGENAAYQTELRSLHRTRDAAEGTTRNGMLNADFSIHPDIHVPLLYRHWALLPRLNVIWNPYLAFVGRLPVIWNSYLRFYQHHVLVTLACTGAP